MCGRFRPTNLLKDNGKFFVRMNGNEIANSTKKLDLLQKEFQLPFMTNSNARQALETRKGKAGLSAE